MIEAKVGFHESLSGRYRFVKHKAGHDGLPIPGTAVVAADWFDNLITDQGLDRIGDNHIAFQYCQVGTGNNTPAFTDTQLETWLAGTSTVESATGSTQPSSPYYASYIITYRFAAGVATGNISEVGIGWASSGTTLFSRALILDGGGTPTTITVLADEILDVTYEYRVYPPEVDTTGIIVISGANHDFTARACKVTSYTAGAGDGWGYAARSSALTTFNNAYTGALGAITGQPAGSAAQCKTTTLSNVAYVPGSLERTASVKWTPDIFDIGSYMSFKFTFGWCTYQFELDPVVLKTPINELSLTVYHTWARKTIP